MEEEKKSPEFIRDDGQIVSLASGLKLPNGAYDLAANMKGFSFSNLAVYNNNSSSNNNISLLRLKKSCVCVCYKNEMDFHVS